jgi:hypothetical protein
MSLAPDGCAVCELERILKDRSGELRGVLQKMNPVTDPGYAVLFAELLAVDGDLRTLRGQVRR